MREILFKGKRVDNGEWVYGYYWYDQLENRHMIQSIEFLKNGWNQKVIPDTVGQYTGLKDKNGKDVYEGDVIRDIESIVFVKFVDGEFSVQYRTMGGKWRNYGSLFDYLDDYEGEIIGNIHENPELLEESRG